MTTKKLMIIFGLSILAMAFCFGNALAAKKGPIRGLCRLYGNSTIKCVV